jgi:amidohydrolase
MNKNNCTHQWSAHGLLARPELNLAFSAEVAALLERVVGHRRALHQIPELGLEEHETARYIAGRLAGLGLDYRAGIAGTGLVAVVEGQPGGPTVAFRADMDALPIEEANDVPYRSRHAGRMHACGHDGHVAVLLTLAELLASRQQEWAGRVVCIFQPAEEGPGGAQPMIEAGVLRDYPPSVMLGMHLWNLMEIGHVGLNPGAMMAGTDEFDLLIRGTGGHGAFPHQTTDVLVTAAQLIMTLQTLVSRNLPPLEPGVVTIGAIHGGTKTNIIPAEVALKGTLRATSEEGRDLLEARFREVVAATTAMHGNTFELDYRRMYPVTINDPGVTAVVREAARSLLPADGLVEPVQVMGAEDMSYWLREVPGCYFFVGSRNAAAGLDASHHTSRFNFDERAMLIALELLYRSTRRLLRAA